MQQELPRLTGRYRTPSVRKLKPLVSIGCPRIGLVEAVGQIPEFRYGTGPKSEGSIDMQARGVVSADRGQLLHRVEAKHTKFAIVAPVTKPTEHSAGSPRMSNSQWAATFSANAAAGEVA